MAARGVCPDDGPRVVLHADDFGMNAAVSRGILQGLKEGLLTSASALTNAPHASQSLADWKDLLAAQQAGQLPSSEIRRRLDDPPRPFDLGAHLNLTQGRPLTAGQYPAELLDDRGRFPGPSALFRQLRRDATRYRAKLQAELQAQIEVMLDHSLQPTHLNGHQYVEMMPGVSALVPQLVEKYAIPAVRAPRERGAWLASFQPGFRWANAAVALVKRYYAGRFCRTIDRHGIAHPDAFFGSSHAGCIDLGLLHRFVNSARSCKLGEIAMHPGCLPEEESPALKQEGWHDPLFARRPEELEMLVSPELAEFLLSRRLRLGRMH